MAKNEIPVGQRKLKVLIASATSWPASAKLAISFLRHGSNVEAVCAPDHPLSYVSRISKFYPYRVQDSLQSLNDAITTSAPDLIVPSNDGVVRQLHELHRTKPELRSLIERSLGSPAGYDILASRAEVMNVAQELGVRIAHTKTISTVQELREWFSQPDAKGVLKLDGTYAGKGVQVVSSFAQAEQALTLMSRPPRAMEAWGRWFALRDAMAVWNCKNHRPQSLTMQHYVVGRPANTLMACRNGKVLATVTVEAIKTEGATGPASVVRLIDNEEIRMAAERIATRLQLSGFHGLDFMLEDATGDAYLIELNPRTTQLGHLPIAGQGDLAHVLCLAFGGTDSASPMKPPVEKTIAFFPQVLASSANWLYAENAYVDVPWEEPELVRQLTRRDWRERRWFARLYYAVRPSRRSIMNVDKTA